VIRLVSTLLKEEETMAEETEYEKARRTRVERNTAFMRQLAAAAHGC